MYKLSLAVLSEITYNIAIVKAAVDAETKAGVFRMKHGSSVLWLYKFENERWSRKMKRFAGIVTTFFLCLLMAFCVDLGVVKAELEGPDVYAEGYCVMDAETGEIIIHKNMDERFHPASITKVLTALVTLENCDNLDDTITFSDWAINSCSADSSTMPPKGMVGEQMSVRDVLYGMLLASGNECANALAEYIGGDIETFAEMMNDKAKELGAVNSHFVNAHGLDDPNHYTTPHDMALIFQEALKNPTFVEIDSTATYTIPATNMNGPRALSMGHQMVTGQYACEGVFAGKTGNTAEAGRTLLMAANRDGRTVISVIMKSNNDKFYMDTDILLEYGFGILEGSMPEVEWQEKDSTVWATGNVTIREFPSTHASEMGVLTEGESIERVATYGDWSRVKVGENEYYVSSLYLTEQNPDGSGTTAEETAAQTTTAAEAPTTEAAAETQVLQETNVSQTADTTAATDSDGAEEAGVSPWIVGLLVAGIVLVASAIALMIMVNVRSSRGRRRR